MTIKMKLKETAIKALSLGTGVAIGLLLIAKVCYEKSHDTCYANPEQIYRIRTLYTMNGDTKEYDNTSGAIAPGFRNHVPGVMSPRDIPSFSTVTNSWTRTGM